VIAALEARHSDEDARASERVVTLARLLAERLVGRALELDGSLVLDLARQVVAEARGARRIALFAHPEDAPALRRAMADLDPESRLQSVTEDSDLGRGDLRLETEVGAIVARLEPSLERLAVRLAEALRS
jgi:flagellar biosynthesis/type III secretory pathway protein FliH